MKTAIKYMLAALALGASVEMTQPARAQVAFGFNFGNVQMGYSDGYYDRYNRWHYWQSPRHADYWRRNYYRSYHNWRHDDRRYWRNGRRW